MKGTTEPNSPREGYIKKGREALSKLQAIEKNLKKEMRIKTDLEEARKIWEQLSKRFRWWHSLHENKISNRKGVK